MEFAVHRCRDSAVQVVIGPEGHVLLMVQLRQVSAKRVDFLISPVHQP